MRAHEFPEELRAPLARGNMGDPAALTDEVADHGRAQPVDVVGGDRIRALERDVATATHSAPNPIQRLDAPPDPVLREVPHTLPQLILYPAALLAHVLGAWTPTA